MYWLLQHRTLAPLAAATVFLCAAACTAPLPPPQTSPERSETAAHTRHTRIGQIVAPTAARHPGKSGIMLLDTGEEAYTARLALIEAADRTIDLQYYLWKTDNSGLILVDRLIDAANRGVRVRILIDDILTGGDDGQAEALARHPNIEVRNFNPLNYRSDNVARRYLLYVAQLRRFNYRMHNKFFIVDNQAVILGGRNIGDDYFGLDPEFNFRDLEVVACGPAATQASDSFDTFWNSEFAYPVEQVAARRLDDTQLAATSAEFRSRRAEIDSDPGFPYPTSLSIDRVLEVFKERLHDEFVWAEAEVVADLPGKRGRTSESSVVADSLAVLTTSARSRILAHSAYFVPTRGMIDRLRELSARGITVEVLTNSLASNNHVIAHSGYSKYRKRILATGTHLFELNPNAASRSPHTAYVDDEPTLGLHTKALVNDNGHAFVGSFNLDPRSFDLNTESGLLIRDPVIADELLRYMEVDLRPENSYRIEVDKRGLLRWTGTTHDGRLVVKNSEPDASVFRRAKAFLYSLLPLDSQL